MDNIFQLPLLVLALLQVLLTLLLLAPKAVALGVAKLLRGINKNPAATSVVWTIAIVLGGLLVSCLVELHKGRVRADVREVVGTIDYLRAQVSCVLCALNLLLLFLSRALSEALCAEEHSSLNLAAMKRQVVGLQTEYKRVTSGPASKSDADAGSTGASGADSETAAMKKLADKLIQEKTALQTACEAAEKARATAEASVVAMKSQLKGFDAQFDRILEENKLLKRKLVGTGDATYASEVNQMMSSSKKAE